MRKPNFIQMLFKVPALHYCLQTLGLGLLIGAIGQTAHADALLDISQGDIFAKPANGQLQSIGAQKRFSNGTMVNTAEGAKLRLQTDSGYFLSLGSRTSIKFTNYGIQLLSGSLKVEKLSASNQIFAVRFNQFQAEFSGRSGKSIMYNSTNLSSACLINGQIQVTKNRAPLATLDTPDYCVIYDQSKPELSPVRILQPDQRNRLLTETTMSPAPRFTRVAQAAPQAIPQVTPTVAPQATAPAPSIRPTTPPKPITTPPLSKPSPKVNTAVKPDTVIEYDWSAQPSGNTPKLQTQPAASATSLATIPASGSGTTLGRVQPLITSKPKIASAPLTTLDTAKPVQSTATLAARPQTTITRPTLSPSRPAKPPIQSPSSNFSGNPWNLYVQTTRQGTNAQKLAQKLQNGGYQAVVTPHNHNGAAYFRVAIVNLPSLSEALAVRSKIETRYGIENAWVSNQEK